jgi:hypothetical protein
MRAMIGRTSWILWLSLVLVGGCGKKNAEPTTSPDSDPSAPASDEAAGGDDATGDAEAEGPDAPEETAVSRKALLKLKLERNGKTIEHPGHMVELGEGVIIVMSKGGHEHEIDFLYDTAESGFALKVTVRDNGREVLRKDATAEKQQWIELESGDGKTVLSLFLDPDAGRADEVEVVGGDDPLGGVE